MLTAIATASLKGYVHIEFWGQRTSRLIFTIATVLACKAGAVVKSRDGYDAPNDHEGGEESAFTFDIEATPAQFRTVIDGLRTHGIRVKEAQLGDPEGDWD